MNDTPDQLESWINQMAKLIEQNEEPDPKDYIYFIHDPEQALRLIGLLNAIEDPPAEDDELPAYYSACILAIDVCIAQLQAAGENGNKLAFKILNQLMHQLAKAIESPHHSLGFWMPILNGFYDVHVDLSTELKQAYLLRTCQEDETLPINDIEPTNTVREIILELADLSVFDITEHFFAQSYAMPADYFSDLVYDLYSIDEGQEIAVLTLLHPQPDFRAVVVATLDHLLQEIVLSPLSLTRLEAIKHWYPVEYHAQFNRWIKHQRKKGVVFQPQITPPKLKIKASEVDGTGAQGLLIYIQKPRAQRLSGMLLKHDVGIKDAWLTPIMKAVDATHYFKGAYDEAISLRDVDLDYLTMITNHFLAVTIEKESMPDLHLLEIQEQLGLHFKPKKLDSNELMKALAIQITPFTQEYINESLKRSKLWPKNKQFTESWFLENPAIDRIVNRQCAIHDGIKVCNFHDAIADVFVEEMEHHRETWLFHFLWIALWLKSKSRPHEKTWQDSFLIAYMIQEGQPLTMIPIMHEICHQSVINSIETMHMRRTHLNLG